MLDGLTIHASKPRVTTGAIEVTYTTYNETTEWRGGGTFGHIYPVDGYFVLVKALMHPVGVFVSLEDFAAKFEAERGVKPTFA